MIIQYRTRIHVRYTRGWPADASPAARYWVGSLHLVLQDSVRVLRTFFYGWAPFRRLGEKARTEIRSNHKEITNHLPMKFFILFQLETNGVAAFNAAYILVLCS